ncbi:MAG TPA: histidine kinase [Acidimicrobiales bacterium]|jgi:signal transduction histidine kinase
MTESGAAALPTRPPLTERLTGVIGSLTPAAWARIDVAVALAIFVGFTTPALLGYPSHDGSPAAVLLFGAGATLPIAARRRWPLAVLAVVVVATTLGTMLGVRFTPFVSNAGPGVVLAMYTVAERFPRRLSLAALAVLISVTWAGALIADAAHPQQDHDAVDALAALGGWVIGDAMRARRAYRAELAAHRRDEVDQRARRGIAEERLRISREVHDVVSHSLSVIAVQAGVGRLVFDTQPDKARAALAEVESLSRGALDELRRLLGVIRRPVPTGPLAGVDELLAPAPGLDNLPELVGRLAAGGMDVTLHLEPPEGTLPPMLELTAYRIVQEALTNVVKHADAAPTRVTVRPGPGALLIDVVDDGRRTEEPATSPELGGGGWGIAGMRERAGLFGGTVSAGPDPAGGFRVSARLPLKGRGQ